MWNIGRQIVEFEQAGKEKAEFGTTLLKKIATDLKLKYGKGFSKSNIYLMRLFFLKYEKFQTVSGILSWSKYCELLAVSDDLARSFYEKQCLWSVRELKRQINSGFFERLALSRDKKGGLELARKGQVIKKNEDSEKYSQNQRILFISETLMTATLRGGLHDKTSRKQQNPPRA